MNNSLLHRVDNVRQMARRVVWCYAIGWVVALSLATFFVLALVDYCFRPIDLATRCLMSIGWLAALSFAVGRWLRSAWWFQPTLLETAQRIEQRYGTLAGRLAGSVEFLQQAETDPAAGSLALRRRVVAATEDALAQLDLQPVINTRPQWQGVLAAGTFMALVGIWSLADMRTLGVAVGRLTIPWSSYTWPRRNHLEFVNSPARLARGQNWEAAIRDSSGRLPDEVTLAIRYANGEMIRHPMKFLGGQMVHRLENITQSLEYRASGGDDDTLSWQSLEVVEPLRLMEIHVQVQPPAYAGPSWEATGNVFTLLSGSTINVQGRVDRPLASAVIRREKSETEIALPISSDGYKFGSTMPLNQAWQPRESGTYILSLQDIDGITNPAAFRWEVRVVQDNVPTLTLDSPADGWQATPQALLPVEGVAKDDLALKRIALRYLRPAATDEPPAEVVLWQADRNPMLDAKSMATTGGEVKAFAAAWDLQQIAALQPGDVLTWYVQAEDYLPQAGQTAAAKLSIISAAEMQERLAQRQLSAMAQLAEALKLQRETRGQISSLDIQWSETQSWRPRDRDALQSAELHQRQVQTLTGHSPTGAATILTNVLREMQINRLELPDMQAQCRDLLNALDQLDRERYSVVGNHFSQLLRETKNEGDVSSSVRKELNSLGTQQDEIIQRLEDLLGTFSEWDNFQRLRRDLLQLRKSEQEIMSQTQKLQTEILTAGKPTSQQTADAKQLARQQSELARQFEKWHARLSQYAQRSDPAIDTARTASQVAEAASELAIAAKMRSASQALSDNKLGTGLEREQEVDHALAALLDEFAGRKNEDSAQQLQQLRDSARRIEDLLQQQKQLANELAQQAEQKKPELQRLEDRQREMAKKTDETAKQMERSQPKSSAGQATKSAQEAMQQAAASAKQKDATSAAEKARAAEEKLRAAKQALQEEIANREADLLREQLVRLEQLMQGLLLRQEALEKECTRLQLLQSQQQGQLTPAQAATCVDLQAEQNALATETSEQSRAPQMPAAFAWQLEITSREMHLSGQELERKRLAETISWQQSASARLRLILLALKQDSPTPPPANEKPPGDQPPPPKPPQEGNPPDIHDLAEVKLLRAMQAEINRRTLEIESQRTPAGELPLPLSDQLGRIAAEQGKLVELTLKLVRKLTQDLPPAKTELPRVSDEDLLKKLDEALLPGASLPMNKPEK